MSDAVRVAVRGARPSDGEALGRLGSLLMSLHHEFDGRRFIAPSPQTAEAYGSFLTSELERKEAILLVAEGDGHVLGYAYARVEGHDWMALRGPAGVIHDLVVDPARRGMGIGKTLLQATLTALSDRGAPRVLLATAQQNEAAQRLFAAAGFRPTMIEMTREWPDKGNAAETQTGRRR